MLHGGLLGLGLGLGQEDNGIRGYCPIRSGVNGVRWLRDGVKEEDNKGEYYDSGSALVSDGWADLSVSLETVEGLVWRLGVIVGRDKRKWRRRRRRF